MLAGLASEFPLTEAEISGIKQTYELFARSGRLEGAKIGTVLRLIGGVPTERELQVRYSDSGDIEKDVHTRGGRDFWQIRTNLFFSYKGI